MSAPEKTFTNFTPEQAAQYAQGRGTSYPSEIYQAILAYHQGERKSLLDVGTGPGKVVFDLLPYFIHGIGTDSSAGMIGQSKKIATERGLADRTSFVTAPGESCDKALAKTKLGSVDVMTVAMAAHWLNLPAFYAAAARSLRPGGTLAMWTASSLFVHPSEPQAQQLQEILFDLEIRMLRDYHEPRNALSRNAYEDLELPWGKSEEGSTFDKASFRRQDWDRDGMPSAPSLPDGTPGPFLSQEEESIDDLEKGLGSASSVIRWREENAEQAFTPRDPVVLTCSRLRQVLGGKTSMLVSPSFSLLLMRRK